MNGVINSSDIGFVQSKSGTGLPTSPPLSQIPPTSYLIYDGWNLIAEFDASGNQAAKYFHGANTDEILERVGSPANVYYHHDALGSTVALSDSNGNVVERYKYGVFGAPTILDPSLATRPSSLFNNRFMFTGREYLSELGLYDYRNRIYSPSLGRFMQTDPIRFDGRDLNLYRYVGNRLCTDNDPFGLCECPDEEPVGDPDFRPQSDSFWGRQSEEWYHEGERCYREDVPENSEQCCYDEETGELEEEETDAHNPDYHLLQHLWDVFVRHPFDPSVH